MGAKINAARNLKSKLLERYAKDIEGVLGCYDRLIITGRLVDVGHPDAMTAQLRRRCYESFCNALQERMMRPKLQGWSLSLTS